MWGCFSVVDIFENKLKILRIVRALKGFTFVRSVLTLLENVEKIQILISIILLILH